MATLKSVFEYENYREFLRDYYDWAKSKNKKFSFRYFSRIAGFSSSSTLKNIIVGKRNVSPTYVPQIAKALKLNREESEFFRNLIGFNQARTAEEKARFAERLLSSKTYQKIHPLNPAQYRYFDHWYFCVIREMVNLANFKEDPEWIAQNIMPPITPQQAKTAMAELQTLGLINRDPATGRLVQTNPAVSTVDSLTMASVAHLHREMMKRASESIDRIRREERELNSYIFSVTEEKLNQIKVLLQEFRKNITEIATSGSEAPTSVYELNIQLFPFVKAQKDGV